MSEPFIGQTKLYGFQFAPEKWAACQGQTLQINDQQALFSLLGNAFGGDGRTTFGLPDLRGRGLVSQGIRPGTTYENKMGVVRGSETHTMNVNQLATHAHLASYSNTAGAVTVEASTSEATENTPGTGSYLAVNSNDAFYRPDAGDGTVPLGGVGGGSGAAAGTVAVGNAGSSQAFFIMQPITVMNYSIAMQGLFPSRN